MTRDGLLMRVKPLRFLVRLSCVFLAATVAALGLLAGCQSKLIYFPRAYHSGVTGAWAVETRGRTVDFTTSQGKQRAFLQGDLTSPRNLWIVTGGNGTVALDWSDWISRHGPRGDAWLLVDFPGYGDCEGYPSPGRVRESMRAVVPSAWRKIFGSGEPDPSRLRFFGHSLGAAACLVAASEFNIQRGVLLSPFTSTMDMARHMTGLPVGFLVTQRFDNEKRLNQMAARGTGKVIVFHGTDDEVIPVAMSRRLAAGREGLVELHEVPGGRHNTLHGENAVIIAKALAAIGG